MPMKWKFVAGALAGALTLSCVLAEQARAVAVYTYTGNLFTLATNDDPPAGNYNLTMSVSGFFSLASPLPGGLNGADITASVQSFSFFDGRNTLTNSDASSLFIVSTDVGGAITNWDTSAFKGVLS